MVTNRTIVVRLLKDVIQVQQITVVYQLCVAILTRRGRGLYFFLRHYPEHTVTAHDRFDYYLLQNY